MNNILYMWFYKSHKTNIVVKPPLKHENMWKNCFYEAFLVEHLEVQLFAS